MEKVGAVLSPEAEGMSDLCRELTTPLRQSVLLTLQLGAELIFFRTPISCKNISAWEGAMSMRLIHLRKLLKIMYSAPNRRISALRSDIREDLAKAAGQLGAGGDFYGPFWSDAKDHVFGRSDLHETTKARILGNPARANLYPQLQDGFLLWWDNRRRWTNEPFRPAEPQKARYAFPDLNAVVKVDNILSVRDGAGVDHFVYPYFSPDPQLEEEAARLGLWLLGQSLPNVKQDDFRVLDVIRGATFSTEPGRHPLIGDEEDIFRKKYGALLNQWESLRRDYE